MDDSDCNIITETVLLTSQEVQESLEHSQIPPYKQKRFDMIPIM